MSGKTIDSIETVDVSKISFEDIYIHYSTGRSIVKDIYSPYSRRSSYRSGFMTNLGDIEHSVWMRLAEKVIELAGETKLFQHMNEHLKQDSFPWIKSREERWETALEYHCARLFDSPLWIDYISFNREYRPDVLERANIIWIAYSCCQLPFEVTQQRYDSYFHIQAIYNRCPFCGQESEHKVVAAPKLKNEEESPCLTT